MGNALCVKGFYSRHPGTCGIPEQHTVFHMDGSYPPRCQDTQELRCQEIHLLKKPFRALVVPKIIIVGAVFVMVPKRDGGMYQPNAIFFHLLCFLHAVRMYCRVTFPFYPHCLHPHFSFHLLCLARASQPVFFQYAYHLLHHLFMVFPFLQQGLFNLPLVLHVNDINDYLLFLQEAVAPVHCLDKIVEFVINPQEYLPVAVLLEIAAGAGQGFLCCEQPCLSFREVNNALFAAFVIHAAVNVHGFRHGFFDCVALILQIMPQDEAVSWGVIHNLFHLFHTLPDTFPLYFRCLL